LPPYRTVNNLKSFNGNAKSQQQNLMQWFPNLFEPLSISR